MCLLTCASDETREKIEDFANTVTLDEIASIRDEMEELRQWDLQYFKRREELIGELNLTIDSAMQIGISLFLSLIHCRLRWTDGVCRERHEKC